MFHVVVSAHHSCDDTEMSVGGDEDEVKGQLNGSDGGRLFLHAGGLW
jgi:hypothetical protein